MIVQLRDIPEEGLQLTGKIQRDIFELAEEGFDVDGPVSYDLNASIVGDSVLVMGEVSAPFKLRCGRCLEDFRMVLKSPDFAHGEPLETSKTIDLTEAIREDILLALPIHPLCENGTPPRDCPAAGQFDEVKAAAGDSGNRDAWADLEKFKPSGD